MFDVSWSDPKAETIAQRRRRKEGQEKKSTSSSESQRSFQSSRSKSSSSSDKFGNNQTTGTYEFGFGVVQTKKVTSSTRERFSKSTISTVETQKKSSGTTYRKYHSNTEDGTVDSFTSRLTDQSEEYQPGSEGDYFSTLRALPSLTAADDSLFSHGTENTGEGSSWGSVAGDVGKTCEVQALSSRSFVTRSTEVKITTRDITLKTLDKPLREISISVEPPSCSDCSTGTVHNK
jgi:hypothetical protein